MARLNAQIPLPFRCIQAPTTLSHPICQKFVKHVNLSEGCNQFLNIDVEYVSSIETVSELTAEQFYRGYNPGWSAVEQSLDAKRDITERLLIEHFIKTKDKEEDRPQLILIKAYAGAGKTVLLRRLAWRAARDLECLCIFLNNNGTIDTSSIQEIVRATKERIFLFVDDIGDHSREVEALIRRIGPEEGRRLTIIGAERINEWFFCENLWRW